MVDGGQPIGESRLMGESLAPTWAAHHEAPPFALPYDPTLLKLREDEHPDAVRWPDLAGIEVHAVTDGMAPAVADRLVAVLLEAGADVVNEFNVVETVPCLARTHAGVRS